MFMAVKHNSCEHYRCSKVREEDLTAISTKTKTDFLGGLNQSQITINYPIKFTNLNLNLNMACDKTPESHNLLPTKASSLLAVPSL
jgi:hypothetical protein